MVFALMVVGVAGLLYVRSTPRPMNLPLVTYVDGPSPARAAGVVVFLHGLGGSNARVFDIVEQLRQAGLPPDIAIVLLEGPFVSGLGHSWGRTQAEQATSRARVRSRLA